MPLAPLHWHWIGWSAFGVLVVHASLFLAVALHLFRHRRRTDSTLLWLGLTWSLPLVGAVLYAMFGVDRVPRERWRRTQTRRDGIDGRRREAPADVLPYAYWQSLGTVQPPDDEWTRALDRPLAALSESFPLLAGNEATPLLTGDEAFPPMLDAIRSARHHIHLQSVASCVSISSVLASLIASINAT